MIDDVSNQVWTLIVKKADHWPAIVKDRLMELKTCEFKRGGRVTEPWDPKLPRQRDESQSEGGPVLRPVLPIREILEP